MMAAPTAGRPDLAPQWTGTIYRQLRSLGAPEYVAKQVAGNCQRCWYNSDGGIRCVLTIVFFDGVWVVRLS